MKHLTKLSLVMVLAGISTAFAGGTMGNGGNAVVCYTDETRTTITSIEMFDYWEMDKVLKYPGGIRLGTPQKSVKEKIDIALARMDGFDWERTEEIRQVAYSIANNLNRYLVTKKELPEIEDYTPIALPEKPCFIEQFAVQWQDPFTGQHRFAIAAKFFNHAMATNEARAGLILHEAIYRHAILRGAKDSDGSRYMNYVLATSFLEGQPIEKYITVLEEAKVVGKNCKLVSIDWIGRKFYLDQNPFKIRGGSGGTVKLCISTELTNAKTKPELGDARVRVGAGTELTYSPQSRVDEMWSGYGEQNTTLGQWNGIQWVDRKVGDPQIYWEKRHITMFRGVYLNGQTPLPFKVYTAGREPIACVVQENFYALLSTDSTLLGCLIPDTNITQFGYSVPATSYVEFDTQGRLRTTYPSKAVLLPLRGGSPQVFTESTYIPEYKVHYGSSQKLEFDELGQVTRGKLQNPPTLPVNGVPSIIHQIYVRESDSKIMTEVTHAYPALYQGKRIIGRDEWNELEGICNELGYQFEGGGWPDSKIIEDVYISGIETVYDPELKRFVEKNDETVPLVIDRFFCNGSFVIQL